jgi:hypothetical protein
VIRGLRVPVHLTTRDALRIFDLANIWAARTGNEVRLVSANDHVHSRGSAHYEGLAVDFHSSDPDGLSAVFRRAGYRVLWKVPGHYSHVHVQDDQSRGSLPQALYGAKDLFHRASRPRSRIDARTGGENRRVMFASQ